MNFDTLTRGITADKVSCMTPQLALTWRNNNLFGAQINLFGDQNSLFV